MTWIKIDDAFPDHPKVHRLGTVAPEGMALYIAGLCYAGKHLTDGVLPRIVVPRLVLGLKRPYSVADRLVAVGLWDRLDDEQYEIHDYLRYQPSRAKVGEMVAQRQAAGHNGGVASGEARREATRLDEPKRLASSETKPVRSDPVTSVTTRPLAPLGARDGLPNIDDGARHVLEDVTGRSVTLAGDRQLTEYDRLIGDYGLPKVRAAMEACAKQIADAARLRGDHASAPTARQVVWGAMKLLEPMPSAREAAKHERDEQAERISRIGFARTAEELARNPMYQHLRDQERKRAEGGAA